MIVRRRAVVGGVVQGVGFRPFVARLAADEGVGGFVANRAGRVVIEVEGEPGAVSRFADRLAGDAPRAARIDRIDWTELPAERADRFEIVDSETGADRALPLPPDLAVCPACRDEALAIDGRRAGYGFGSCTACGPRFSIAGSMPWDRERTAMAGFATCQRCDAEYRDPRDRRFHAQTVACPVCGPRLALLEASSGERIATGDAALEQLARELDRGAIVALKGVGGFLLLVRADDEAAVRRLRRRKRRPTRPMAVMVADIAAARAIAEIGAAEAEALEGPAAPIALCRPRPGAPIAAAVAPGVPRLGVMLPATPLHALIAAAVPAPLVATSGNVHQEPLCTDSAEAVDRLGAIADLICDHDRAIFRPVDDSVVDAIGGAVRVLRMGRGLAPCAIALGARTAEPLLATGGHLKNAPALAIEDRAILWPHVGDLDHPRTRAAFAAAVADLERFFAAPATRLAIDAHPDYATALWAESDGRPSHPVFHHHAHVAACLAEHGEERALGFAWDGVGHGVDPATPEVRAWGGEVLDVDGASVSRIGHLLPFPLVGGDAAARDGRRALAGMCAVAGLELPGLERLVSVARLGPQTTSAGRLFDAVAALTGVCEISTFEGEAAMRLEAIAEPGAEPYPTAFDGRVLDWRPALAAMVDGRDRPDRVASRFHATLIAAIAEVATARRASLVALTGGCMQNQLLVEGALDRLAAAGIRAITPRAVPPNDGGLALGQAWVALRRENGTMAAD